MTITWFKDAEQALRTLCRDLSEELRAKGHPKGFVAVWIGQGGFGGSVVGWIDTGDPKTSLPGGRSSMTAKTIDELAQAVHAYIAALPDPNACDAWFDEAHPLNQQPVAEAAE